MSQIPKHARESWEVPQVSLLKARCLLVETRLAQQVDQTPVAGIVLEGL